MFALLLKYSVRGLLIGLLVGVLAGGLSSALFGQPFSGVAGLSVFPLGMVFPGLILFAPVTAGVGALLGAGIAYLSQSRDEGG